MTHDFGTRQEAHYEELAALRMELLSAQRRAEKAEQTTEGIINTLRPILPSGFRGDNPIWACGKLVDHVEELRTVNERMEGESAISAIIIARQGEQIGALETEFAHKASQYDDVVKALQVADGGKYRNDTIETMLTRLGQASELAAHIERLYDGVALSIAQRALLNRARAWREDNA